MLASVLPALSCRLLDRGSVVADVDPPCAQAADPSPGRAACAFGAGALARETIACPASGSSIPIEHVIVVMQENRSFDHYLGHLPGHGQDDVDVADGAASNPGAPGALPSAVPWTHADEACFDDPDHSWEGSHLAWGAGRNDGFVAASAAPNDPEGNDAGGIRAMGY
jgi:phospholipase C